MINFSDNSIFIFDGCGGMFIFDSIKTAEKFLKTFKDISSISGFDSSAQRLNIKKEKEVSITLNSDSSDEESLKDLLRAFIKKFKKIDETISLDELIEEAKNCYKLFNWNKNLYTR